jgi:outer membrane protein assembly factor BamB
MRSRTIALAITAAGSMVLAGCGDDGDADSGSDGSGGAPDGALTQLWESPSTPAVNASGGSPIATLWATESVVVEISNGGLRGLDPASGKASWEMPPPSGAGELCAFSPSLNEQGIGAVLFNTAEGEDSCGLLAVVDANAGGAEPLWTQDVTPEDGLVSYAAVSVAGDAVTATLGGTSLDRFSVTGEELPAPEVPGGAGCQEGTEWIVGGERLLAVTQCDIFEEVYQLTEFDAASGEQTWTLPEAPAGFDGATAVVPGDLLSVQTEGGELLTFDDTGAITSELTENLDGTEIDVDFFGPGYSVVHGSTLLAVGALGSSEERIGVDLATGSKLWQESFVGGTTVGGDAERVMAVYGDDVDYTQQVESLDPQSGKRTEVGALPDLEGEPFVSANALTVQGDTLYVQFTAEDDAGEQTVRTAAYELP